MHFDGRLYFDFSCPDVWRMYRFLAAAATEGADVALDWEPFIRSEANRMSLVAHLAIRSEHPESSGAFVQSLLTQVHGHGERHDDLSTIVATAAAIGVDGTWLSATVTGEHYEQLLDVIQTEAVELGVSGTPTLYRNGPTLYVEMSGAADSGDVLERLRLLDGVLGDDGLWVLRKP